jgi:hypothetical protein
VNLALVSKIPKHKPIFPALIFETAARTAGVTGYLQVGARLAGAWLIEIERIFHTFPFCK